MRLIDQLAELQALDSQLDHDRRRYTELQAALQEPSGLKDARSVRDEAAARLQHWREQRRLREKEVTEQEARIQAQEVQLYGGKHKDPREQVALQKNVEVLKRRMGALEETAIETIQEWEQAQADLSAAEGRVGEEEAAWKAAQVRLLAERESLVAHATRLKAHRDATAAKLQPATLRSYDAMRQKRGGVAVADVRGGACSNCGAALPTALAQQTHGSDLLVCAGCGRWLHSI